MANKDDFYKISNIPAGLIHDKTTADGKEFKSVGIPVPYTYSKNGIANIAITPKLVFAEKDGTCSISIPKTWTDISVSVATTYFKDDPEKTTYSTVKAENGQVLVEQNEKYKELINSKDTKETEEPEADVER